MSVPLHRLFVAALFSCAFPLVTKGASGKGESAEGKPLATPNPAKIARVLPPEDMSAFKLPPGYKIELVASEPMIEFPVAIAFDPDGRIWVVEMSGYMPDVFGKGEQEPVGQVSVLEDKNGDGRMDKKTVFMDKLVLPRAVALDHGGVIIVAPPNLWFAHDKKGDGVLDEKTAITSDLGNTGDPEYKINGLMHALDNWIYCANYGWRWRNVGGQWQKEVTPSRGQWGITQDDFGRLFYSTNASMLRVDPVPVEYARRNPHYVPAGANMVVNPVQKVWPTHHTIVNRGSEDKNLTGTTATCGTAIYRGDLLPELRGNAMICEPAGNLVKRNILTEKDGIITGKDAYDKQEFLTSTDERFRPVNAVNGPDGALYIVDMHHGLIQHRSHLTDYARNGYIERGLDQNKGLGRIYRIVPAAGKAPPAAKMNGLSGANLVAQLAEANGWRRDTAQQLLVERADAAALPALKKMAAAGPTPLAKIHALWTLAGLGEQDLSTLTLAMKDADPKVRATAIRVAEPLLANPATRPQALAEILKLAADGTHDVAVQLGFTLSVMATPEADQVLVKVLTIFAPDILVRDAVLSGLAGRELAFLERMLALPEWQKEAPGRGDVLTSLASCVFVEGSSKKVAKLLDLAAGSSGAPWRETALLGGAVAASKGKLLRKPVQLDAEPAALVAMVKVPQAQAAAKLLLWPGKPGYVAPPPVVPLTSEQKAHFAEGKKVFEMTCIGCHQQDGKGREGLAPPLLDSEWVLGSEQRLAQIVLCGLQGPVTVNGQTFNLEMPGLRTALTDQQIADVLTYVRREWEHTAAPVSLSTVAGVRKQNGTRDKAFTEKELQKIKE